MIFTFKPAFASNIEHASPPGPAPTIITSDSVLFIILSALTVPYNQSFSIPETEGL
jgi:hypothetical protein